MKKNSLFPHQVMRLILLICEAATRGDICPPPFAGSCVCRCALGIYDGSCNQCIGDPKHLMFSAVVESKIQQENNKYFFN